MNVQPVTPSPRRRRVGHADHPATTSNASPAGRLGLLPPPLYHGQNGVKNKVDARGSPIMMLTDKNGNRIAVSRSTHTFRPVVPQDERNVQSPYHSYTPPTSPFKSPASPYKYSTASPSPSMVSITTAETSETMTTGYDSTTSFCTMSPTPSFVQQAMGRSSNWDDSRSPHRGSPNKKKQSPFSSPRESDDPTRKQRVKTEMCLHFMNGNVCPFGSSCTYAHGEDELQLTKLLDLQRSGLIDVDTYRTSPCLTWVTTGSCPFGKRCCGIHDVRIAGSNPSWLPHTETQGNSMNTDINVDGLHQKRLNAILHGNPFGDQFSLDFDDWGDLYKLVCNTNIMKRRRNTVSELHKLSIALHMRGESGRMYKFRPQHVVYNSLCMILQKQAFRLDNPDEPIPISLGAYDPKCATHVLVREIAFGPDSDSTVRGVALWFNIPEEDVQVCTPQQAKRFRWKKGPKQEERIVENTHSKIFDSRECFVMIRPHDHDAFELTTRILKHRLETAKTERLTSLSGRFEAIKTLQREKDTLAQVFRNQRRHWISWAWPINTGRQTVDDDTPVPSIDGPYVPLIDEGTDEPETFVSGSAIQRIWDSFVSTDFSDGLPTDKSATVPVPSKRLPIFERLENGEPISPNRCNPHILHDRVELSSSLEPMRQSQRCWKSLLHKQSGILQDEWEVVLHHFKNARCKKVLKIIQQ